MSSEIITTLISIKGEYSLFILGINSYFVLRGAGKFDGKQKGDKVRQGADSWYF